ncbi:MAG: DUF3021 domain-containing protein [Clostridia bacterium]|nr:DUF3021 domain-containing protein [Clostridia bacterium]
MKRFIIEFLKRGLICAAGGPIIISAIYLILGYSGVVDTVSVTKIGVEILTATLMAFIAAGITAVYQIERISAFSAALIHGIALYLDYIIFYLINGWLKSNIDAISIFTAAFVGGYAIIWLIIYLITKKEVKKLNSEIGK